MNTNFCKETDNLIYILSSISNKKRNTEFDKNILKNGGKEARSSLDNINYRKEYKTKKSNAKTEFLDEYTNETIKLSNTNVDHIVPLNRIRKKYKDTSFLTTKDIKNAANKDDNLALISENLNKSKGDNTNLEFIMKDKTKTFDDDTINRMISAEIKAEDSIKKEINKKRIDNLKDNFKYAVKEDILTNIIPLAFNVITNIFDNISGKKDKEESTHDIIEFSSMILKNAAISGGIQTAVNWLPMFKKIPDFMPQVIGISYIFVPDCYKYINEEIDSKECINNITKNAVCVFSRCVARKAGECAGKAVINMVSKEISKIVISKTTGIILTGGISFLFQASVGIAVDYALDYIEKEINKSEFNMINMKKEYESSIKQCAFLIIKLNTISTGKRVFRFLNAKESKHAIDIGLKTRDIDTFLTGINGLNVLYGNGNTYNSCDFQYFCFLLGMGEGL